MFLWLEISIARFDEYASNNSKGNRGVVSQAVPPLFQGVQGYIPLLPSHKFLKSLDALAKNELLESLSL
jgi:hypothetical protein